MLHVYDYLEQHDKSPLDLYNKTVTFSENVTLYETYSKEEYDRKNTNMPSLEIKVNAKLFGGGWLRQLKNIQISLDYLKYTEMNLAYNNTQENIKIQENTINIITE